MIYAWNAYIAKKKDEVSVALGFKSQEDIDIRNEADAKSYIDEINLIIDSQLFVPKP